MRKITVASLAAACLMAATPSALFAADPPKAADGLQPVQIAGLQQVEARVGADLSRYTKVILDPIEVAFHKDWAHTVVAGQAVSAAEKLQIRTGLARVLREEFVKTLTRDGRYQVVDDAADDVLRIRAEIRDLYINAPDLPRPERVHSYTLSVGEMTLVAEMRDAVTGDLIARVRDRKQDREKIWLELTTSVDNIAEARRAAHSWAQALRTQLDLAHAGIKAQ